MTHKQPNEIALDFAHKHPNLSNPVSASGKCLWAALSFAQEAAKEGLPVDLIRWQLVGESFSEHWAAYANRRVVDLTRSQVDGQSGQIWEISEYPANYMAPRRYPASLLLPVFERQREAEEFSSEFIAHVQSTLKAHDARRETRAALLCYVAWLAVGFGCAWLGW